MEPIVSKQEVEEFMRSGRKTRGAIIKNAGKFVLDKKGEDGLNKLEVEMEKLGYKIKFEEFTEVNLYSLGETILCLVLIKRLFNFTDEDFQELGRRTSKISVVARMAMRSLAAISLKQIITKFPETWSKMNPIGELTVTNLDEKGRSLTLRVDNCDTHPIQCQIMIGAFSSLFRIILGKEVSCTETKCIYKQDDCHEFLVKW